MRRFSLASALVPLALAALLGAIASPLAAASPTDNEELRLGKAAFARGENAAAADHLGRAAAELDIAGDTEALAAAYLELGRVQLIGLDRPHEAIAAFLKSAELAAWPADALLWAAEAADKLGLAAAAKHYRAQALRPPSAGKEAPPVKPAFHSMGRPPARGAAKEGEPKPAAAPGAPQASPPAPPPADKPGEKPPA
jgi:tetratricopeptide (TPR) repeat protein